jgi:hypothetical protein
MYRPTNKTIQQAWKDAVKIETRSGNPYPTKWNEPLNKEGIKWAREYISDSSIEFRNAFPDERYDMLVSIMRTVFEEL